MRGQISGVLVAAATVVASTSGSAWAGTIYSNSFDAPGTNDAPVLGSGVSGGYVLPFTASTTAVSPALAGVAPLSGGAGAFSGRMLSHAGSWGTPTVNRLVLTGLSAHTSVSIGFLVAMLDQWKPAQTAFQVSVGDGVTGNLVFSSGFDNSSPLGGYTSNRMDWGAALGGAGAPDAAYDLSLEPSLRNIPHTAATLTVTWALWVPPGPPTGNIHSYAIDNLTITTDDGPIIPLPSAGGMAMAGLGLLAVRRRRARVG